MGEGEAMTTPPNDDFDMCCGNRPHVFKVDQPAWGYKAVCWICGYNLWSTILSRLMVEWNKAQREKVK